MPRTRTDTDRDSKVAEILAAAQLRLRDGGYEALSVAGIARELGVAQNAIYWYFPSKDHLFVAALEELLREIASRKPPKRRGEHRQILWWVDQLQELEDVRAAMYERARTSEVVAAFVAVLNGTWRSMLSNALADSIPEPDRAAVVDALLATIQGVLMQPHTTAERRRIIEFAIERLMAPSQSG
jgi:TetR/AcrR family transcriptional regulator, cholesterol catabolism regulator